MADDDAQLAAAFLSGEPAAVRKVREWVDTTLGRYRGRLAGELEDVEQDVVLDLMEALAAGRFRAESRLETYVRSYARFQCIDRLRAQGRRDMVELGEETAVSDADSPLDELTRREADALALRVLEALPEGCRELWGLIAKGLSYQQMSSMLGAGEGAIRVRVHRCRQRALEIRRRLQSGEGL